MCAEPSSVVEIQCCDNLDSSVNSVPSEIQSSATLEITYVSEIGLNESSETAGVDLLFNQKVCILPFPMLLQYLAVKVQ